jgi:DNA-binding NtrC family response regulator
MIMKTRLLIVDDEEKILKILSTILKEEGYDVHTATTGEDAVDLSVRILPEIILMDLNLPGISGIEAIRRIRVRVPAALAIILTAYGTISSAVEAMKTGAYDYLTKPFDNDDLIMTVKRAESLIHMRREINELRGQLREKYQFDNIIGQSPKMRAIFQLMERVSDTDATVLVEGESGTGKELIVRAIHHSGPRKDGPLITVNCGAIPHNLVESEFFGHEKGAFTDARAQHRGAFERATGGTLFLDEIGELPMDTQVKLLRVLEAKTITRIGGSEEIPVDVRILTATNKNLEDEVKAGRFRSDLYFRLNVFYIHIPPLRERKDDIPLLVDHFLNSYRDQFSSSVSAISSQAVALLIAYDWPGNVRELANAVQSALIICRESNILPGHLPLRIQGYPRIETVQDEGAGLEERISSVVEDLERQMILDALDKCRGSRTEAARLLKISRKTLFNKMQKWGIETG